jgi:hypothetical protein
MRVTARRPCGLRASTSDHAAQSRDGRAGTRAVRRSGGEVGVRQRCWMREPPARRASPPARRRSRRRTGRRVGRWQRCAIFCVSVGRRRSCCSSRPSCPRPRPWHWTARRATGRRRPARHVHGGPATPPPADAADGPGAQPVCCPAVGPGGLRAPLVGAELQEIRFQGQAGSRDHTPHERIYARGAVRRAILGREIHAGESPRPD